jgi:hypothetical protein
MMGLTLPDVIVQQPFILKLREIVEKLDFFGKEELN